MGRKLHKQCLFCILIEWSACFDTLESGHKAEYHKNMKISWEALQVQCTQAKIRDKSLFGKKSPGCTISNELLLGKKIEVWTPMLNGNLYLRYQCLESRSAKNDTYGLYCMLYLTRTHKGNGCLLGTWRVFLSFLRLRSPPNRHNNSL